VRLAAVVGLMIEEMPECETHRSRHALVRRAHRLVAQGRVERRQIEGIDVIHDLRILGLTRDTQASELRVQDLIERADAVSVAGETPHPDPITDQDVIERTVDRAEECRARLEILGLVQPGAGRVESLVRPSVVACECAEIVEIHRRLPRHCRQPDVSRGGRSTCQRNAT